MCVRKEQDGKESHDVKERKESNDNGYQSKQRNHLPLSSSVDNRQVMMERNIRTNIIEKQILLERKESNYNNKANNAIICFCCRNQTGHDGNKNEHNRKTNIIGK